MTEETRYVTRWALTTGIRTVKGRASKEKYFSGVDSAGRHVFVSIKEAFVFSYEAEAEAKKMAAKRAARLRKQAQKLSDPAWQPKWAG